jgi:hypothetical protein
MSIHDEIGDYSGGQTHYWPGQRSDELIENFQFNPARSGIALNFDAALLEGLPEETIAALIASSIYENAPTEFGTEQFRLAKLRSREIAALAFKPKSETDKGESKTLLGYIAGDANTVAGAQSLAWLASAIDAGVTEADLLHWGVPPLTVIQLLWWQRREGETRLNQHIRAHRNGWQLPVLSKAIREAYGNLLRFVAKGQTPDGFEEHFAHELAEVRELLTFFGDQWDSDGDSAAPVVSSLAEELAKKWAFAFAQNISFIAPDAKGRWASLPKVSLDAGELRYPANLVARYLDSQGYKPGDVGGNLTEAFFGRVGDSNV